MIAIQADESGTPVLMESFNGDGGMTFQPVTPERWQEILSEGLGGSFPANSIVPIAVSDVETFGSWPENLNQLK